jgi:hypothetical protein
VRTPRIPETDLARIAVCPVDEQRILLQDLRSFRPPHTLNPFRQSVADILNLQPTGLLGSLDRTPWPKIQESIERSKETEDGIAKNLGVAKALFEFSEQRQVISYGRPVPRWNVGYGIDLAYWNQFYSVWGEAAAFVHFDPRLTHPLTEGARRFVFSLMHQRLRVDDPDFADVGLKIFRFGRGEGDRRTISEYSAEGLELYDYAQLNEMIGTTYRLWVEEIESRQRSSRRAVAGSNPFGF